MHEAAGAKAEPSKATSLQLPRVSPEDVLAAGHEPGEPPKEEVRDGEMTPRAVPESAPFGERIQVRGHEGGGEACGGDVDMGGGDVDMGYIASITNLCRTDDEQRLEAEKQGKEILNIVKSLGGSVRRQSLLMKRAANRIVSEVHSPPRATAAAKMLPDYGVLPGFGTQRPNPWGIGPEIRGHKDPHWTAASNSPHTYGHFGQVGTMLWIDPDARAAAVALCTEPFGPWAAEAWPRFSADALASAT